MDATHDRNRPGGLLRALQRRAIAQSVAHIKPDPYWDGGCWEQHLDLDQEEARWRPATWERQYDALLNERPRSAAELMDRFIEECRGEISGE